MLSTCLRSFRQEKAMYLAEEADIGMGVKEQIGEAKDRLVSVGAKAVLNHKIAKFGECTSLQLDSDTKTVRATLSLLEESQPLQVDIDGYVLYERNGMGYLRVESFHVSKAWLNELAKALLVGVEVRLPRAVFDFLWHLL